MQCVPSQSTACSRNVLSTGVSKTALLLLLAPPNILLQSVLLAKTFRTVSQVAFSQTVTERWQFFLF